MKFPEALPYCFRLPAQYRQLIVQRTAGEEVEEAEEVIACNQLSEFFTVYTGNGDEGAESVDNDQEQSVEHLGADVLDFPSIDDSLKHSAPLQFRPPQR